MSYTCSLPQNLSVTLLLPVKALVVNKIPERALLPAASNERERESLSYNAVIHLLIQRNSLEVQRQISGENSTLQHVQNSLILIRSEPIENVVALRMTVKATKIILNIMICICMYMSFQW